MDSAFDRERLRRLLVYNIVCMYASSNMLDIITVLLFLLHYSQDECLHKFVKLTNITRVLSGLVLKSLQMIKFSSTWNGLPLEICLLPKNNKSAFCRLLKRLICIVMAGLEAPLGRFLEGTPYKFLKE